MLVVVVQGNFEEASKTIEKSAGKADLLEFRLDLFASNDVGTVSDLKNRARVPVMFTLRPENQGGRSRDSDEVREDKWVEFLSLNPDYVDLEYGFRPAFVRHVKRISPKTKVVISYHDFQETPANLNQFLAKMLQYPADIYKIACHAKSSLDALRMLAFVQKTKKEGFSVAGMSMGPFGEISRILAPVVGSELTYAPLELQGSTAPGQVTVDALFNIYHFKKLNLHTDVHALLGDPVDKSLGHICHNRVFDTLGINAVYVKILVRSKELPQFFTLADRLPFRGFSVTMPLKESVIGHVDCLDFLARKCGAVNTLHKTPDGRWKGYNTDAKGALDAIEARVPISGKRLLLLGSGGTAKSLAVEAHQRGAQVLLSNRTHSKAEELAKLVNGQTIKFEMLQNEKKIDYDILVNTTSIGMAPTINALPVSPEQIIPGSVVFDSIWNPLETLLLKTAKSKGCQVIYGSEMFTRQALEQEKIWIPGISEGEALKLLQESLVPVNSHL